MINKNLSWKNKPFLLKPVGKNFLWGGRRLKDDFGKELNLNPLAETWECSTHPDGPSIVASGEYKGWALRDLLEKYPEMLGENHMSSGELPILIKFIDASKDLSVQVHPDDAYAMMYEKGSSGKSEMWYVLDAEKEAKLIYGFYRDIEKRTLEKSLLDGSVEKYLRKVKVKKDDVFYIEAGTVHAIGKGILIAEIQQNSNLTYRLYDYNRVDKDGKKRELHVEKALSVVNFQESPSPKQPMRVLKYRPGFATELLCRCKYFQVERMLVNTERFREMADFQTDKSSFQVLLCIGGCGVLSDNDSYLNFFKGDCIFIPAGSERLKLHGKAEFLKVSC